MRRTRMQSKIQIHGTNDDNDHFKQETHTEEPVKEEQSEEENPVSISGGTGMTEYERKRLENIQRNLAFMKSMGVSTAKLAARTAAQNIKRKQVTSKSVGHVKRHKKTPIIDAEAAPIRRSLRVRGVKAEGSEGLTSFRNIYGVVPTSFASEPEKRLDAHFSADAVNVRGKGLGTSFFGESTEEEEDLSVDSTGMDLVSYTLDEEDVIKALEERVYSMEFYPRSDRILIASGDKRGNLALWTPDTKAEDPIAMYRPHIKPLTQLHFAPHDPTKLVSASYDGIVREFDLQAGMFTELFATEEARDLGLTSMALDQTNGRYLASDDDGHVWSIDARASTSKRSASCYHLHEKKVNTVHVHPTSPHYIATASLDRTVCLWDSRKLSDSLSKNNKMLVTMPHDRSVNCAYFSPQGEHLVTVCQNNYVYLYDTKSPTKASIEKPTLSIPHDNHTGRWLTKFHAAWDPKQSKQFVLGCMLHPRRIQIFDATRKRPIQELTSDFFNSVHSINAFHPILPLLTGGNSSGRLCLWRYNN